MTAVSSGGRASPSRSNTGGAESPQVIMGELLTLVVIGVQFKAVGRVLEPDRAACGPSVSCASCGGGGKPRTRGPFRWRGGAPARPPGGAAGGPGARRGGGGGAAGGGGGGGWGWW